MEKEISDAERKTKSHQKKLEHTAEIKKAEDIANLDGTEDGGSEKDGDADTGGQRPHAKNMTGELTKKTPEEVFAQFDTDGSGLIDFDEFRAMLPQLGITITMPKVRMPSMW